MTNMYSKTFLLKNYCYASVSVCIHTQSQKATHKSMIWCFIRRHWLIYNIVRHCSNSSNVQRHIENWISEGKTVEARVRILFESNRRHRWKWSESASTFGPLYRRRSRWWYGTSSYSALCICFLTYLLRLLSTMTHSGWFSRPTIIRPNNGLHFQICATLIDTLETRLAFHLRHSRCNLLNGYCKHLLTKYV